jgi:hypothetical protein
MPIVLGNTTITGLAAGGLPANIITSANMMAGMAHFSKVETTTTSTFNLTGDSNWQNYMSLGFTVGYTNTSAIAIAEFANGYEQGAANFWIQFVMTGATSQTSNIAQLFKQGYTSNKAYGNHQYSWTFSGLNAGAHTCYLQLRNFNANGDVNRFNPGGRGGQTNYEVVYIA